MDLLEREPDDAPVEYESDFELRMATMRRNAAGDLAQMKQDFIDKARAVERMHTAMATGFIGAGVLYGFFFTWAWAIPMAMYVVGSLVIRHHVSRRHTADAERERDAYLRDAALASRQMQQAIAKQSQPFLYMDVFTTNN